MSNDFIGDLLNALKRVLPPDVAGMRDILIVSGMPEKTENLRYLALNRQIVTQENSSLEFSAVAVINNRRVTQWRLEGYRKKISQLVFRWTRNHLDLFLNSLRCDSELMNVMASSEGSYTLLGILKVEERPASGMFKRKLSYVRPVIAVPDIDEENLKKVVAFEKANQISQSRIGRLPTIRKVGQGMSRP